MPAPWVLKPRSDVSAVGIQKLHESELVWRAIDALDARPVVTERSTHYLLERFVPGDVFHVDSLVENGEVDLHRREPLLATAHGGGAQGRRVPDEHRQARLRAKSGSCST